MKKNDFIYPIFEPGDVVVRIDEGYSWEGMIEGQRYTVLLAEPDGTLIFQGMHRVYHSVHFRLVRKHDKKEVSSTT